MKRFPARWHPIAIWGILPVLILGLSLSIPQAFGFAREKKGFPLVKVGDNFPDLEMISPREKIYREYLGLSDKTAFRMNEIQAQVLIVEFLNKYCYHCQQQAYLMNRLYKAIQKDPELKGRVKLLGIGVGNNWIQLTHFRQEKRIPFPLIPDQDFIAFEGIGYPGGTPFTLILKKEGEVFVVKNTHLGVIEDREGYLDEIRQILTGVAIAAPKTTYKSAHEYLNPGVTEEEIKSMIKGRLQAQGIQAQEITPLKLEGFNQVFMIKLEKEGKLDVWFATLGSEGKVCDVCHDIHFLYLFDRQGIIRDFVPIHVTKYGNKPFEEKDIEKTRQALVGKNLTMPIQYNPQTDAVTSASMTSALIFKSVKDGSRLFEALKKEGYTQ
jgi:peroxiredoxin